MGFARNESEILAMKAIFNDFPWNEFQILKIFFVKHFVPSLDFQIGIGFQILIRIKRDTAPLHRKSRALFTL